METVINVTQNLTQNSLLKIVGNDDPVFVQNFQFNITVLLTTLLVSLISAPFLMILVGLIMFTAKQSESTDTDESEVKSSLIKTVPFTSFIQIFIKTRADITITIEEIVKRFGLAFKLNILGLIKIVCINDPVMLKKLDIFMEPVHLHKPSWYHKIMPRLRTDGSTTTPAQREALVQAFNKKNLQNHLNVFKKHAEIFTSTFEEVENNTVQSIKCTEILDQTISKCTFDMLLDISFGSEKNIAAKDKIQLLKLFERVKHLAEFCFNHHFILPTFLWALHPVNWYMKRTFRQIFKTFNKISEYSNKPESTDSKSGKIIDMSKKPLIEVLSNAGLSNEEITTEVTAFMAWGHGTVSWILNKLMFHLADQKRYQEKCQQEIDAIFTLTDDNSSNKYGIINDSLYKLELLDRCIQECLRMYPTFPLFSRNVNTTVQLDKNITIPAGTKVVTCHKLLHRNPDNYPNPETFNPDRFLPEELPNRDVYEYMSCSLGPSNCIWHLLITQLIKVLASQVLRDFNLHTETQMNNLQNLKPFITSSPKNIIKLRRRRIN